MLEFLIKNGSERVIDDARAHIATVKILRNFHYIDQQGKDQGVNVRHRAQELTDLLGNSDQIRQERKKAKSSKNKYTGTGNTGGFGGTGKKYGGFGNTELNSYGGYSGGVYGDGGGFSAASSTFQDESGRNGDGDRRANQFEEYDEFDEGGPPVSSTTQKTSEKAKPKAPEVDLFSFGDEAPAAVPSAVKPSTLPTKSAASLLAAVPISAPADDDDFDDFQTAPSVATPAPSALLFAQAPSTTRHNYSQTPSSSSSLFTMQPNNTVSGQRKIPIYLTNDLQMKPSFTQPVSASGSKSPPPTQAKSADAFGNLWSMASSKSSLRSTNENKSTSMASLAKQNATQGIWTSADTPTSNNPNDSYKPSPILNQQQPSTTSSSSNVDLLM